MKVEAVLKKKRRAYADVVSLYFARDRRNRSRVPLEMSGGVRQTPYQ